MPEAEHALSARLNNPRSNPNELAPYASRMARSANDLVTKIRQLNQTYKRLLKGDVKYRFVIDKWTH
jgi:D-arabinose 1-dehydrogenase-like Zn-dependent alcohol dehydrogenase